MIKFFGLTNTFTIYYMLINNTFIKYLNISTMIYLSNIIIYLKNLNKYKEYIKIIFNKLPIKEFRYKLEKYKLYKIEINFLRLFISIDKIKIDSIKIKIVKK